MRVFEWKPRLRDMKYYKACVLLQVNLRADEVHARCFHVEFVVQSADVATARPATRRLLTETRPANIQVPASVAG